MNEILTDEVVRNLIKDLKFTKSLTYCDGYSTWETEVYDIDSFRELVARSNKIIGEYNEAQRLQRDAKTNS